MHPVWGQGFGPAAELPLGAELYVSTGHVVAGEPADRVFNIATHRGENRKAYHG